MYRLLDPTAGTFLLFGGFVLADIIQMRQSKYKVKISVFKEEATPTTERS